MKKKKINSRSKGQRAERKLVKLFEEWWGSEFFRTPGSGAFATMGFNSKDVNLAGDICTLDPTFPFCVESKKVEGWTLEQMLTSNKTLMHGWWAQTIKETPQGMIPLLVFTKNRAPLYAMMRSSDDTFGVKSTHYFETWINGTCVVIFALEHLLKTDPKSWVPQVSTFQDLASSIIERDNKLAEEKLKEFLDPAKVKPSKLPPHPRWPRM